MSASHAASPRPSASAGPDSAATCRPESGEACGPATPTAPTARPVVLLHLQLRRDLLSDRLRRLQRQSRSREASACSRELRAVTTQLMTLGQH